MADTEDRIIVTVSGRPGAGKSALLAVLAEALPNPSVRVLFDSSVTRHPRSIGAEILRIKRPTVVLQEAQHPEAVPLVTMAGLSNLTFDEQRHAMSILVALAGIELGDGFETVCRKLRVAHETIRKGANLEHWRDEVGKKQSQIDRLTADMQRIEAVHELDIAMWQSRCERLERAAERAVKVAEELDQAAGPTPVRWQDAERWQAEGAPSDVFRVDPPSPHEPPRRLQREIWPADPQAPTPPSRGKLVTPEGDVEIVGTPAAITAASRMLSPPPENPDPLDRIRSWKLIASVETGNSRILDRHGEVWHDFPEEVSDAVAKQLVDSFRIGFNAGRDNRRNWRAEIQRAVGSLIEAAEAGRKDRPGISRLAVAEAQRSLDKAVKL